MTRQHSMQNLQQAVEEHLACQPLHSPQCLFQCRCAAVLRCLSLSSCSVAFLSPSQPIGGLPLQEPARYDIISRRWNEDLCHWSQAGRHNIRPMDVCFDREQSAKLAFQHANTAPGCQHM